MPTPALIFYYRSVGKFALNTLAAALETDPATAGISIEFPATRAALISAIETALAGDAPVVVGWSFFSPAAAATGRELAAVRGALAAGRATPDAALGPPHLWHIAGGVHASAEPAHTLGLGFDLAAIGEGERIIIDLLKSLASGADPRAVQGIAHLQNGELRRNGRGELISLDDYPAGAERYGKYGPIEITRGCLYACKFCQTPFLTKARFRHRGPERIRSDLRAMRRLDFRDFRFLTPTALSYGANGESPDLAAVEALLATTRAEVGAESRIWFGTFPSEVRPEHVSPEALALIRRYCDNDNLIIGGQSGSEAVLARTHRGHDVEAVERAVRLTVEAGLTPNVDFLFGLPGENEEEMLQSVAFAERLAGFGARIHCHAFMPLPGTPFKREAPAFIPDSVRIALERLANRGGAYGPWQRQVEIAVELARARFAG